MVAKEYKVGYIESLNQTRIRNFNIKALTTC